MNRTKERQPEWKPANPVPVLPIAPGEALTLAEANERLLQARLAWRQSKTRSGQSVGVKHGR